MCRGRSARGNRTTLGSGNSGTHDKSRCEAGSSGGEPMRGLEGRGGRASAPADGTPHENAACGLASCPVATGRTLNRKRQKTVGPDVQSEQLGPGAKLAVGAEPVV